MTCKLLAVKLWIAIASLCKPIDVETLHWAKAFELKCAAASVLAEDKRVAHFHFVVAEKIALM